MSVPVLCLLLVLSFFFFKQKTAYEMRISDWSSDVCSSDLAGQSGFQKVGRIHRAFTLACADQRVHLVNEEDDAALASFHFIQHALQPFFELAAIFCASDQAAHVKRHQRAILQCIGHVTIGDAQRSEEHTSELQSLMRISYAVCCLKKKQQKQKHIPI